MKGIGNGRRKLLRRKVTLSAFLLALISVITAVGLSGAICARLIRSRAEKLDEMLLQTAADRTNQYLGEIAEVINLAVSSGDFDTLLALQGNQERYEYVAAMTGYVKYLRTMTLNYDSVDNFIYLSDSAFLSVHEDTGDVYEAQLRACCEAPGGPEGRFDEFFLLNLHGNRSERIAILRPISDGDGRAAGYVAAVLSEWFAGQLQFAGEQLYLRDQMGNHSYLKGTGPEIPAGGRILEREMVFPGWKLRYVSQGDEIVDTFRQSLWGFAWTGGLYLLLAAGAALLFGREITRPLREMQQSLKRLARGPVPPGAGAGGGRRVQFRKRRIHFKHRLMIFYTVLVAAPTIGASAGFYLVTQTVFDQKIGYFFEHRTNFLFDQLDLTVRKYQRTIMELAYQPDVQRMMNDPDGGAVELEGSVDRIMLQKQTQNQGIMNIALFDGRGRLRYSSFYNKHFIDSRYSAVLAKLQREAYAPYWGGVYPSCFNKDGITMGLTIFSMPPNENTGRKIGAVLLDFDTAELDGMIREFEEQGNARLYLFDRAEKPVLSGQEERREAILARGEQRGDTGGGKPYVLFAHTVAGSNWQALAEIPRQEYLLERMSLLVSCLCILAGLLTLCFLFAYFSTVAVSRNVDALLRFVRQLANPRGGERFQEKAGDEIEELGNSFNDMLDALDELARQQLAAEIEIKNAQLTAKQFELNLLQSQINPHFLYNTLKTVQYMAHTQDPRAERMIKLLIHLFRTGISRGERLVTVEEEMKHVTTYLEIQQIRFSDKFRVDIRLDSGAAKLYLLKLTLQPIVENAIYHGLELLDREGLLQIEVQAGEELVVRIDDNGNGMTEEKLASIREQLENGGRTESIGLFNVHERIRLFFGPQYGVSVESRLHEGTRVILRFPRLEAPVKPLGDNG